MGSKSSGNQTTQVKPPKYAQPYLSSGLERAEDLYQAGGPQQYQGNTVTPFSSQTEQSFGMIQDRALNGSPVADAATNLATRTLNGDFLNSNPFLDSMFDRAAGASQRVLDSQFAGYGRDVSAQLPFRQQQLNDLATQIYGQNYENERNRQMGMLPFQGDIADQAYRDAAHLGAVGNQIEGKTGEVIQDNVNRWNFEQQRPESNLDNFMGRVNAGTYGQTQVTPTTSNPLGSAAGGAMMGSAFGPWGALIGGGLGALGGLFG